MTEKGKQFSLVAIFLSCIVLSCTQSSLREQELALKAVSDAEMRYESPNWTERVAAIQEVSRYQNPRCETFLLNATKDPHTRVRIEAIGALSAYLSPNTFETIRNIVETEKDNIVKYTALNALSKFQNPRSAPVFIAALKSDDWMIRETAIIGLLDIPDPAVETLSVQYIINALSDPNESVRLATLSHLRIKDEKIYFILRAQLTGDSLYYRPEYLKVILSAIHGYQYDDAMRRIIMKYITHPNTEIRILALRCIKTSDNLKKRK
jgi:HEAT repeat protein